jgi:hypothetical protein
MPNKLITVQGEGTKDIQIEVPSIGVGTMRTSGAWLVLMLAAEEPFQRPQILLEVMECLGISIQDLQDQQDDKPCGNCGISLLAHRATGGKCP